MLIGQTVYETNDISKKGVVYACEYRQGVMNSYGGFAVPAGFSLLVFIELTRTFEDWPADSVTVAE